MEDIFFDRVSEVSIMIQAHIVAIGCELPYGGECASGPLIVTDASTLEERVDCFSG